GYWQQYHCKNQLPGKLHSHILSEKSGLKRKPPPAENLGMFVSERFDINQVGKSGSDPTLSIASAPSRCRRYQSLSRKLNWFSFHLPA
ncbi:MAG: hypothetical protein N0E54_13470, partial [Candidatus Thiodiazotropha taylori]|nr:hypothetical protein [Candidatus Thiodiazotropha endolucinida]MCW4229745.1 hypothetical protein [Candidatus Thiodiazotropha taylori]